MDQSKIIMRNLTFESLTKIYTRNLEYAGVLANSGKSFAPLKLCMTVYFNIIAITVTVTCLITAIKFSIQHNLDLEFPIEFIAITSVASRYFSIFLKRKHMQEALDICNKLWDHLRSFEYSGILFYETKLRKLYKFFAVNVVISYTLYAGFAYFIRLPPDTPGGTEIRILPFRLFWVPQTSPAYEIAYFYEVLAMIASAFMMTGVDVGGLLLFPLLTSGFLRVLKERFDQLQNLSENVSPKKLKKVLISNIKFHQKILRLNKKTNDATSMALLNITVATVGLLVFIGLQIILPRGKTIKYVGFIPALILQNFVCQWISQNTLNASEELAKSTYFMPLKSDEENINKTVWIVNCIAKRHICMEAGGFYNLSMETFGKTMSKTWSLFTILWNTVKNEMDVS